MKGILATVFAAPLACAGISAQTYQLPDRHAASHDNLLPTRAMPASRWKNTTKYLEELFNEEEEPEFDIYTEGWDSKRVNCYSDAAVPSSAQIDVSRFSMPHPGYITSPYGYRRRYRRMHKGVDLKVNIGDTIRAAFDGRVRITNFERRGYGNYVVLRHTNDLETVYGHLSAFLVEEGQYVKVGRPYSPWRQYRPFERPSPSLRNPLHGLCNQPVCDFRLCEPDNAYRYLYIRQAYISECA